jgi:hypothetical protein
VLVDVERGRTVKGWLPRRLGKFCGNIVPHISWLFVSMRVYKFKVADPDPNWIRIQSGQWIRIQEGKNDPQK